VKASVSSYSLIALYRTAVALNREDNKSNKGSLDSRPLSDDGNIAKQVISSCHDLLD
jgi:hypothetical protein